ncbi:MAG TPA: hypothetical protein VIC08_01405 [Cellvibrionaceae bacterium]
MHTISHLRARSLRLLLLLAVLTLGACSDSNDPVVVVEPPIPPEPDRQMLSTQAYTVAADDRLVVTSVDPALVRVELILDENSGEDSATVTLLEGEADLFQ